MEIIKFFNLNQEQIKEALKEFFNIDRFEKMQNSKEKLIKMEFALDDVDDAYFPKDMKESVFKQTKASLLEIEAIERNLFKEHFMNLFHFLDYLAQTDHNMNMFFEETKDGIIIMNMNGDFVEDMLSFCTTVTSISVIDWYDFDASNIKALTFKDLEKDIEILKQHYLVLISEKDIDELFEEYKEIRKTLYS